MRKRREAPRNRAVSRRRAAKVRKLPPQAPAARDEGPRLIPLRPIKDFGLARIEHYLELADKALGRTPSKLPDSADSGTHSLPPPPGPELKAAPAPKPLLISESALLRPQTLLPPRPPPMMKFPNPPLLPRPPKLAAPKPPRPPSFPKPPRLVPKPPRRGNS